MDPAAFRPTWRRAGNRLSEPAAWTITILVGVLVMVPSALMSLIQQGAFISGSFVVALVVGGAVSVLTFTGQFFFGMFAPKPWLAPAAVGVASAVSSTLPAIFFGGMPAGFGFSSDLFIMIVIIGTVIGAIFAAGVTTGGAAVGVHLRKKKFAIQPGPTSHDAAGPPRLPSFERID